MDTDSTSSTMALTAVLDVPELLENTLSFLPKRELITSVQRVSRTWRSSIAESPRIQRRLFSPKGNKHAALPAWWSNLGLLGSRFGTSTEVLKFDFPMYKGPIESNRFFEKYPEGEGNEDDKDDALHLYAGCEFGLSSHIKSNQEFPERKDLYVHSLCFKWSDPVDTGGTPEPAFSSNPDLSWRHMQLCDPPVAVANLHVRSALDDDSPDEELYATIFDRAGIKMGLVHETVAAMIRSQSGEEAVSKVYWSSSATFGIEGCDVGSKTDNPDEKAGENGVTGDGENLPEQNDAGPDEMEEDDDEGVECDRNDAEDDSVSQEDPEEDETNEYSGEALDL